MKESSERLHLFSSVRAHSEDTEGLGPGLLLCHLQRPDWNYYTLRRHFTQPVLSQTRANTAEQVESFLLWFCYPSGSFDPFLGYTATRPINRLKNRLHGQQS